MVDLDKRTISLDGQDYPIKSFAVWWLGPLGFMTTLELAQDTHKSLSLDETPFSMVWKAVPVAISANGIYEELR